ncbi:MafI family immunity protein [Undibacterium sp. TJN25]|uniref:MafI family immunity protein n=1 Tax=Undibacterium sp. TJN25 TaxID=3413056 RepID=UPI003BF0D058
MPVKRENIILQCETAALGVLDLLNTAQKKAALEYILRYDEWLLALEFIIDWLDECDQKISSSQFSEFEKAYEMMSLANDERLQLLRSMVIEAS